MDGDHSNKIVIFEHRHGDNRADATNLDRFHHSGMTFGVGSCRCEVGYVNGALCSHDHVKHTTGRGLDRTTPARFKKLRRLVRSHEAKSAFVVKIEAAEFGVANANCFLQHRLEHGLKITGGATDNPEHFRRGRLLF